MGWDISTIYHLAPSQAHPRTRFLFHRAGGAGLGCHARMRRIQSDGWLDGWLAGNSTRGSNGKREEGTVRKAESTDVHRYIPDRQTCRNSEFREQANRWCRGRVGRWNSTPGNTLGGLDRGPDSASNIPCTGPCSSALQPYSTQFDWTKNPQLRSDPRRNQQKGKPHG